MKRFILIVAVILLTLWVFAPVFAVTSEHSTTNGVIIITNKAAASEWRPQSVFIVFPAASTGTVTLSRASHGVTVPLARRAFTNVSGITWIPATQYPIRPGDLLSITSNVRAYTVQIERNTNP